MSGVQIYRGINRDGKTVSVVAGEVDTLIKETVEKFTGETMGNPQPGTIVTPIAEVAGLILSPSSSFDEGILKYEEVIELDEEAERINDSICENGLSIIGESAEEFVSKADEVEVEERTVYAPVLEPNDGTDGAPLKPDKQKEIYSAEVIRKTAHYWMENGGVMGLMHRFNVSNEVSVLESSLAPVDFTFKNGKKTYKVLKGTWLLRVRINNDEMWAAIKKGEFGAFSVGGTAIKQVEEISKNG